MKIKPVHDNIIIKLPKEEKEKVTKSGIVLSTNSNDIMPEKGMVVAIGSGRVLSNGEIIKTEIAINDTVIFSKFAGTKISDGEEEYLIIKENDILAIVKE